MTDPIPGKRYGALHAWQDGDGWSYLPAAASPQRNPAGRAQLTVVETGGMLMLTLGASLTATEDQLAEAQAAIAAGGGPDAGQVRLRPANVRPRGASLTFTPADGSPVELARAQPSALPPHGAAFSAMLHGGQARAVSAAMKDGTGRLEVTYDMDLSATRAATARLTGDPGDAGDLTAALAAGDLTLTLDADAGASDQLRADARQRVMDEAARMLAMRPRPAAQQPSPFGCDSTPDTTRTTTTNAIDAHVTRTEPVPLAVKVSANVADWL